MKVQYILIVTALLWAALPLAAEIQNSQAAIGVHFGTSTGSGYAMRWMGPLHGLQVTFGAYTLGKNKSSFVEFDDWDSDYGGDTLVTVTSNGRKAAANLGLNYIYNLDDFRNGRVYIMGGATYQYFQQKKFSQDFRLVVDPEHYYNHYEPVPDTEDSWLKREHRWTVGAGPGFEWALGKQFRLAVELPITYNWKHDIVMWIPQAGIYYYFK